ncbi:MULTISPECIES: GNAT family N-acetyltransferase [unclassified Caballeronia]|uniref:GNAT family N-acetyltransferase n=1 Tax=unclassified Caballeronia TaxID=2646786 RepID=UPI00285561E6|nr:MULTISPECIES: GNAT family N-acetyltransferase [unclassified Caballeronia]MDR5739751.1 GNAT family N-acetyltransferase [Caballeronia sp. LZ016]MDR5808216.1 GNAT family N-acetyltransferase [Caballeronia sp. LZ019]
MSPSPDDPRFIIRRMSQADLVTALDWAAAEGWNPGLDDARCFHAADPDGFFVGTWDGEPIACISAVAYDDAFGFIGLYIVRPEWRGKGFGIRLWREGIACLGERNIGLDGVVAQQSNYRKSGFVLAYRNVRYQGMAMHYDARLPGVTVVDASSVPFDRLLDYDARCFASMRPVFLRAWLAQHEARALAALDGEVLRGYGVIRRCRSGHKIGPLFADDLPTARALYRTLVSSAEGEAVFLDVPESNASAVALAAGHDMTMVFETARMYTRAAPAAPLDHVFGVTTFELG